MSDIDNTHIINRMSSAINLLLSDFVFIAFYTKLFYLSFSEDSTTTIIVVTVLTVVVVVSGVVIIKVYCVAPSAVTPAV